MKKILFALLLALCAGSVFSQEYIIIQNGIGFGVTDALPTDTGVRIDQAVWVKLTPTQLNALMSPSNIEKPDLEIPINIKKRIVGWNIYYTHMIVEEGHTEVAVLKDGKIQKVSKEGVVRSEEFNPVIVFGVLFIVLVLVAFTGVISREEKGTVTIKVVHFIVTMFVGAATVPGSYIFSGMNSGMSFGLLPFYLASVILFLHGSDTGKKFWFYLSISTMFSCLAYIFAVT